MISHKHKFISVHMNKCAASTMEYVLKPYCDITVGKHANLLTQIKMSNKNYFKFTFIRNPWDKMVSQYHFNSKDFFPQGIEFKKYIEEFYKGKKVSNLNPLHHPWLVDETGKICIDYVGKFHNIQKDFDNIATILNLPKIDLPIKNATKHAHYTEYYDSESREMVADVFKRDIELFNLNFYNEDV